jgi:hypothetical protein
MGRLGRFAVRMGRQMIEGSGVAHVALHVSGVEGALSGLPGQDHCICFRDLDGYRLQLILPT